MSSPDQIDNTLYIHLHGEERRQYQFWITLALGLLAFSVERFDPKVLTGWPWLLILGWLSLLGSVVAGIFQVRDRLRVDQWAYSLRVHQSGLPADRKFKEEWGRQDHRIRVLTQAQLWAFIIGIVLLASYKIAVIATAHG